MARKSETKGTNITKRYKAIVRETEGDKDTAAVKQTERQTERQTDRQTECTQDTDLTGRE